MLSDSRGAEGEVYGVKAEVPFEGSKLGLAPLHPSSSSWLDKGSLMCLSDREHFSALLLCLPCSASFKYYLALAGCIMVGPLWFNSRLNFNMVVGRRTAAFQIDALK